MAQRHPRPLRRVGIVIHPRMPETSTLADDLIARFAALGISAEAAPRVDSGPLYAELDNLDCLITLGGDGTIVRAARTAAGHDVPVLGVNLGQLGFLAELQPQELDSYFDRLVEGDYRVEQRTLLRAGLSTGDGWRGVFDGLNDAVVARGEKVRVISVDVWIDGQLFTTYRADGVIVATATGSTAYSLAVGGPVMSPGLDNLLVIPVAPHLVPTRGLVLPGSCVIRLHVCEDCRAVFSIDGQVDRPLGGGDVVEITRSPNPVGFVRFGSPSAFYGTLFRRLRWATQRK